MQRTALSLTWRTILSAALLLTFLAGPALAQGEDETRSAFDNPTQVIQAESLAEEFAIQTDQKVQDALEAVQQAEADLADAEASGEAGAVQQAEENLKEAEETAEETLAASIGAPMEDIAAMRDSGMGWGEIAHDLGVHPGVLGLGVAEANSQGSGASEEALTHAREMLRKQSGAAETGETGLATVRSLAGEDPPGHGIADGQAGRGLGLDRAKHGSDSDRGPAAPGREAAGDRAPGLSGDAPDFSAGNAGGNVGGRAGNAGGNARGRGK